MRDKRVLAIGTVAFLTAIACGQELSEKNDGALNAWQTALARFQQAGVLIGQAKYDDAQALLEVCAREMPAPYNGIAQARIKELTNALHLDGALDGYYRVAALSKVCLELCAYKEAADLLTLALAKHPEDPSGYSGPLAYCLAESGATEAAVAEYTRRLSDPQWAGSDWQSHYRKQIQLVQERQKRADDVGFTLNYIREHHLALYDLATRNSPAFSALMELKRVLPLAKNDAEKLDVFRAMTGYVPDEDGRRAWEEKLLREFPNDAEACAEIFAKRGERARGIKQNIDEALQNYRIVCEKYPNSKPYGVTQCNVGAILRTEKKYDEAIAEFRKLLASNANDQGPSPNIMRLSQNYHHEAQWAIAECFFAKGEYDKALEAYRDSGSKHRFGNGCGNCIAGERIRCSLHEGLCLEYMGRHGQAVTAYFSAAWDNGLAMDPTVPIRIVDLYESAGQIPELKKILDEQDERYRENIKKDPTLRGSKVDWKQYLPSRTMRRILEIRAWGKAKDWPKLVPLLHIRGTVAGPNEACARRKNFEAVEAAKQLATSPQETVSLLIQHLNAPKSGHWGDYALGLCGTPEAVAVLKERSRKETNCWSCYSLVYSLSLADKLGAETIEALSKLPECKGNLAGAIERYRAGTLDTMGEEKEKPFPPIPAKLKLPARIVSN